MAATLTRRTNRAAIVVMGNSIALYNPPLRVAEEFAEMLDILSGGRLVAGFPVGTSMDTNFAYGVPGAQLRERYYEAHDLIMQAWHNEGVTHFNGKYTQIRYMNPWPRRPSRSPTRPSGSPAAAPSKPGSGAPIWATSTPTSPTPATSAPRPSWTASGPACATRASEPNPYHAGFAQVVCVADNAAEAKELYWPHIDYFYNRCLHVYPGFADAPGYRTLRTVKAGIKSQFEQAQQNAKARLSWEGLVEQGYVIAGGPDYVTEKLNELADNLRVGHLMLLLQMGSMPRDVAVYNTQMFAEKVMPNLQATSSTTSKTAGIREPLPPERRAVPIDEPVRPLRAPLPSPVAGQ
ncbi:LLM class flavin-dependent oxidoreductase [Tepidiforma flava]|uniref:LLM class flavin-dependent oxidoreductase n=1 Tax=Tepidiforma flava TaxID=3004094 RepID=A0ABY7M3S8_9CHLR|nr:LLM class flavin-dependent oxidoreductase [Tepidiforma flava]WBL35214.1 LLM class flavin-dependent oxidoreductase [Tepidiforma flava]